MHINIPCILYDQMMATRLKVLASLKDPEVEDGTMMLCSIPLELHIAGMTSRDYFGEDVMRAYK